MADLAITDTSVARGTTDVTVDRQYDFGETVTAGQAVCLKSVTVNDRTVNRVYKAQCDGTAEEKLVYGVALHGGSAGQPAAVQTAGEITIGATAAVTTEYVLSATAGGIAPHADLVTGNTYSRIGYGYTAAKLYIDILNTGLAVP